MVLSRHMTIIGGKSNPVSNQISQHFQTLKKISININLEKTVLSTMFRFACDYNIERSN